MHGSEFNIVLCVTAKTWAHLKKRFHCLDFCLLLPGLFPFIFV